MRFTRYMPSAALIGTLLLPFSAPAADKEMLSLQRDVADLQQQVSNLQKSLLDPQTGSIAALQKMVQQELDTANKTSSTVNSLSSGMLQNLQAGLKGLSDQLATVAGLSTKVGNVSDDVSNLQGTMKDLQVTVNRQGQMLTDILNQVKLIQAPAAPPPGSEAGGAPSAIAPPPSATKLFGDAVRDQDSGNKDLALQGFREFLRLYPNDPNAIRAQYNIGNIYYTQGKLDEAVSALDAATEQYPKDEATTPSALYMKGLAQMQQKKTAAAKVTFQAVIRDFPRSPEAGQARTKLTSLGGAAPARKAPR